MTASETQTVRFNARDPTPNSISLGMLSDHNVKAIKFIPPKLAENQAVSLHIVVNGRADTVLLEDGLYTVQRKHTYKSGAWKAYLQVSVGTDVVWNSKPITLKVECLPSADKLMVEQTPTILQQTVAEAQKAMLARQGIVEAQTAVSADRKAVQIDREAVAADRATVTAAAAAVAAAHQTVTTYRTEVATDRAAVAADRQAVAADRKAVAADRVYVEENKVVSMSNEDLQNILI